MRASGMIVERPAVGGSEDRNHVQGKNRRAANTRRRTPGHSAAAPLQGRQKSRCGLEGFKTRALAVALSMLAATAWTQESVYLQSGQQYQGAVRETSDGTLRATVGGQEKEFPLDDIHRIEFQKVREFDGIDTVEGLAAASPLFKEALAASTDELKKKYPQAGVVVLRDDTMVKIGKGGAYEVERTQAWRILEQRGADSAFQSLSFFPDRQKWEIVFGITAGPDGKVARVADASVKTEAVYPQYPDYNYQQRMRFSMANGVPGATLVLKTRLSGTATNLRPLAMDAVFWSTEPVIEGSVRIEADAEELKDTAVYAHELAAEDGGTVWRVRETPQVMPEPMMPPLACFAPRLVVAYPKATWADLAREFSSGIAMAPIASPEGTTMQDAYDKVRRDIRLIDVPLDATPKPPAPPAEVLKRGYGNTLEKALVLQAMLEGIGCKAHTVLVRGRGNGPLVEEVPRLRGFNNGVVRIFNADASETWVQPDDRLSAFGELDTGVQGAQGLDLATGEIVTIPARDARLEGATRVVEVNLEADGSAVVDDRFSLTGSWARGFRDVGDLAEEEARKWASSFVGTEIAGVDLVEWTHSDFQQANAEETITFRYRVPMLAQAAGDFLVLRMPNARYAPTEVGRSTRTYDMTWYGRDSAQVRFTVRAPEGYTAYAVGERATKEAPGWRYSAQFGQEEDGRAVTFEENWSREALEAPKDAYHPYREALIQRGVLRNQMMVFTKGQSAAGEKAGQ